MTPRTPPASGIKYAGKILTWRLAETAPTPALTQAFRDAGCVPKPRTPRALAEDALTALRPQSQGWIVQPLQMTGGLRGFEATFKTATSETVDYSATRAWVKGIGDADPDSWQIGGSVDAPTLRELARQISRNWPPQHISYALMRAAEAADGVSLRDGGGVYWIPPGPGLKKLEEIQRHATPCKLYLIACDASDPDAWQAIADSAQESLSREAEILAERITSGQLGTAALETAIREVRRQTEKIDKYERILGPILSQARAHLDKTRPACTLGSALANAQRRKDQEKPRLEENSDEEIGTL